MEWRCLWNCPTPKGVGCSDGWRSLFLFTFLKNFVVKLQWAHGSGKLYLHFSCGDSFCRNCLLDVSPFGGHRVCWIAFLFYFISLAENHKKEKKNNNNEKWAIMKRMVCKPFVKRPSQKKPLILGEENPMRSSATWFSRNGKIFSPLLWFLKVEGCYPLPFFALILLCVGARSVAPASPLWLGSPWNYVFFESDELNFKIVVGGWFLDVGVVGWLALRKHEKTKGNKSKQKRVFL